ncbi:conserved exported hypothetical protein [Imperialibacter sp. EC-SDR9]|nr:conserved exported hypothetical protein [Imperialibacter sp. 75]CAD5280332.1 conserved exported hypothetical protein [Imperialibacter sp. 89]VVT01371.1 conserved exported hypothetical protein [Imperialibacter sp. EC-SDR9]
MKNMETMKRLVFTFLMGSLLFFAASSAVAQSGAVAEFTETEHDFGDVREEEGPITHTFEFVNKGNAPMVISSVKASCGCTTPGWSQEPVLPGEKGFVKAQYNPANRPGSFRKSLTVTSNSSAGATSYLYIKGNVTPKPRTPADDYPSKLGNTRFKYRSMNFGVITTEKPITKEFEVYNDSDAAITFKENIEAPAHIKVSYDPLILEPKKVGKVVVTYDAKEKARFGYNSDNVKLFTDEAESGEKLLYVLATIEEYFPPMTDAEKAKAARLSFQEVTHDFGRIQQSASVSFDFAYTNTGKSPLNIRDTRTNCGCTVSTVSKEDLKPGETGILSVTFDPKGRKGTQQKTITIFSNDPTASAQTLTVKAYVE